MFSSFLIGANDLVRKLLVNVQEYLLNVAVFGGLISFVSLARDGMEGNSFISFVLEINFWKFILKFFWFWDLGIDYFFFKYWKTLKFLTIEYVFL